MPTPTTTFGTPSPTSVQMPVISAEARVEYSRNPASFPIAGYMRIVPVASVIGVYAEWNTADVGRVVSQNDYGWPDGQLAPTGTQRRFRYRPFECERRSYGFTLGELSVDQGGQIDVEGAHVRGEIHRAMVDRTIDAVTVMTTAANWPAGNTAVTIDALLSSTGASWVSSSTSQLWIKKSVQAVIRAIGQATGGVVGPDQIMLVIPVGTAHSIAATAEIQAYMTAHEQAWPLLNQRQRNLINKYSLPPYLYGVEIFVEDTVQVTDRRDVDGTATTQHLMGNTAVFLSRTDNPAVNEAATMPSASTLTGFFKEELNVEARTDSWNRLVEGRVVENRDIVLSSPTSGYLLQDVTT